MHEPVLRLLSDQQGSKRWKQMYELRTGLELEHRQYKGSNDLMI